MAKGAVSKQIVIDKLLEVFDGAFISAEGKEVRIPLTEDGTLLEIKCALTCAKDVLGGAQTNQVIAPTNTEPSAFDNPEPVKVQVSEDEAANLRALMEKLGL